jgi:hypothetical protein
LKAILLCLCAAVPLAAQEPAAGVKSVARTGAAFDGYYFGAGYAIDHIVEWTVPVGLSHRFGERLTVDLSSAFAHASAATTSGNLEVSGATDTDVRLSWAARSGHLIVSFVGTLPTGKQSVDSSAVPLLSALGTEVLGFTTPSFGTGGGVTGGFATAFKLGQRWAGGVGGSYRWRAGYTPVAGGGDLEPGGEGRGRLGVEGPLGGGGYFRGAAVFATSGTDTLAAGARSISGTRILIYSALSLPAGRGTVSLYAYDRYRLRPGGYDSSVVQVPRGNVVALGARLERPLSAAWSFAPNLEFREELTDDPTSGSLVLLGWLVRPGVDLRYRASGAVALLFQGRAAFGRLAANGSSVTLVGPRAIVLLEWAR